MKIEDEKVSVIIVNWNGEKLIKRCLDSIIDQNYQSVEVIFVDNNSDDDSVKLVRRNYPSVKIIQNDTNLGFAEANNVGANQANGTYLFLLNNDAWLRKGALLKLLETIKNNSRDSIVGPTLLQADGNIQNQGLKIDRFGYPTAISLPKGYNGLTQDMFYVSGCALLINKKLWKKLGGLDGRYFMFAEEVDLCWRARLHGADIITNTDAFVCHLGGASLAGGVARGQKYATNVRRVYLRERNTLCTLIKNYPLRSLIIFLPAYLLINLAEFVFFLVQGKLRVASIYPKVWAWNLYSLKGTLDRRSQNNIFPLPRGLYESGSVKLRYLRHRGTPEVS